MLILWLNYYLHIIYHGVHCSSGPALRPLAVGLVIGIIPGLPYCYYI